MRTLWLIIAALAVVAVVEIAALIAVAHLIGVGWTVLLMLATSMLGGWLLRREGRKAWQLLRLDIQAGRPPGRRAVDGLLVGAGGVFMLAPGLVSDVVGLLLIAPPTRGAFRGIVEHAASRRWGGPLTGQFFGPRVVTVTPGRAADASEPIEGEIVER